MSCWREKELVKTNNVIKWFLMSELGLIYSRLRNYSQTNTHTERWLVSPATRGSRPPGQTRSGGGGAVDIPVNNGWVAPRCGGRGGDLNSPFFSSSGPGPHYITGFCWTGTRRTGLRQAGTVVAVKRLWCQPLKRDAEMSLLIQDVCQYSAYVWLLV